ncbi:quinolinate synthase NadA [Deltaproteobacteria bacterium OttesenSCG-928-M10]|nr:quinolinate synthase NadA [Deltaproteobacteria bacterium OttesenSCG-928-M10]
MPEDLDFKQAAEIRRLAGERRAVILAHYYCRPAVQEAADFVGDSLGLAQTAADSPAEVIIFAGVHFMAETASILCPDKTVILANGGAGCPMADMVTAEALAARKKELPDVQVLTYVNSPAAVKALSDICCTSANVGPVLRAMAGRTVLMTPDRNLAAFAQKQVPEKEVVAWDGCCPIHDRLTKNDVAALKALYPKAVTAAHPECRPEVLAEADFIGSTSAILAHLAENPAREFIVLTEEGVGHQLNKRCPDKAFHFPPNMVCDDMKKVTLADLAQALETLGPEVRVSEEIRQKALPAIQKMMAIKREA